MSPLLWLAVASSFLLPQKDEPLDKAFSSYAQKLATDIARDGCKSKRVVVLNFVNDESDTNSNERELGVYLARLFSYYVGEAGRSKSIQLRDRSIGAKVSFEEMNYRVSVPLDTLLMMFQADYAIRGVYHLYDSTLEIQQLVAVRSLGADVVGQSKPKPFRLSGSDAPLMQEKEAQIVPWKRVEPSLLTFLTQSGEWTGALNSIDMSDFYSREPVGANPLRVGQYVRVRVRLDSLPAYLYVLGWDQEMKRIAFLYPNQSDRGNPVTRHEVSIPGSDELGLPIKGPVRNSETGDYNWIKVIVSRQAIKSFPIVDGFVPADDARLKGMNDELNSIGSRNWSARVLDFWVRER